MPDRIAHAHLKDVDAALAARVQAGELTYTEAVRTGMYTPLGAGDVDIAGIVTALRDNGSTAGSSWNRTPSSTVNPATRAPCATCVPAWRSSRMPAARSWHERPLPNESKDMSLRIGVLGASRIAESAIVAPAQELGHRLVAVAARDPVRAKAFADKYGVERVLPSYQDVVNDPEVDVVYNPLANSLHAPWNLAAVAAGKPVLTEKPFARNREEAQHVAAAADAAGVTVMEGFHYLFHPVTRRALELAGDGTLGELTRVEVRMGMPEPQPDDPRWSLELAGGALMDLGCYGLHVMRRLARPRSSVRAQHTAVPVLMHGATCSSSSPRAQRVCAPTRWSPTSTRSPSGHRYPWRRRGSQLHQAPGRRQSHRPHAAGTIVERLGRRASYTYQLEAFAAHVQLGEPVALDTADAVENMASSTPRTARRDGPALGAFVARGLDAPLVPPKT